MKITAQKWGNSLGLRIPAPVARGANLESGSEIELQVDGDRIVLMPLRKARRFGLKLLLSKVTPANIPVSDVWGKPVGKEVW